MHWVTGYAGFIAAHLRAELVERGAKVGGIGPHARGPTVVDAKLSLAALDRLAELTGMPESVFHLAGGASVGASLADPLGDFERTLGGTAQLLEWIRTRSPRTVVVAVSSAAVYGDGYRGPISRNAVTRPFSPYGANKLMMEQLLRSYGESYGLRSVVARLFSVYGPGLRKQLLWDICCRLQNGDSALELGGNGDELRDWTEVRDVARALADLPGFAAASVPVLNLATGSPASVANIARQVVAAFGRPAPLCFSGVSRPGDPQSLIAAQEPYCGWLPSWTIPLPHGIVAYVDWFRTIATR